MFIDEKKSEFGVEPICRELQVAPSSYYAATSRPPSKRSVSDEVTAARIHAVHKCQWPIGTARRRPAELPAGGHENCPVMANRSAHLGVGGVGHARSVLV